MEKAAYIRSNRARFEEAGKEAAKGIAGMLDSVLKLHASNPAILPIAGLGGAALYGGMRQASEKQDLQGAQHQAFQKAMELFPELGSEDPQKIRMLLGSALQVAPTLSTNPLLLGSWIKGLAKGYAGTHISPQDLRQLQEIELGMSGRPPDRQGGLGQAAGVLGAGASLATIMSKMRQGQGQGYPPR